MPERIFTGVVVSSAGESGQINIEPNGAMAIDDYGKILEVGERQNVLKKYPSAKVLERHGQVLLPGFVDTHLHMPQLDMIGSHGRTLIDWLNEYTFPVEARFHNHELCETTSLRLVNELGYSGTTTACAFATVHTVAVESLFAACQQRGIRLIAGKVSADIHIPTNLAMSVQEDIAEQRQLIERWHGKGSRLFYALTPRFAPCASPELLTALGDLRHDYPDVYVQSHLGETEAEIAWVRRLFPERSNYFDVYQHYGLVGPKTVYAHGVHLEASEIAAIVATGTNLAHCPTSNTFLGSGLCPLRQLLDAGVKVGLGSDIGGGTTLSMWATMAEAYKVSMLRGEPLQPETLLHLATYGGARALGLDHVIGRLAPGFEADFQIIDFKQNRLLGERKPESPAEWLQTLFAAMFLADERICREVYVRGQCIVDHR